MTVVLRPRAASVRRPQRLDLGEDPLAELVAWPSERERRVGVQALQPLRARSRAADPEVELGPNTALLLMRAAQALGELGILRHGARPALDAARRLDARD